jgi:hypothetical protein
VSENKRVKERRSKRKSFDLNDDAQCQFGLVLSRDGWISHLRMKHGFAGSYAWVIVNCADAFVLDCFEALVAGILYLLGVQNISDSQKWSSVSRNQCEARANHVCEWSELMLGWQKERICYTIGSTL